MTENFLVLPSFAPPRFVRPRRASRGYPRSMRARPRVGVLFSAAALAAVLATSSAGAQPLQYYGGRVISNVEVVEVAWSNAVDAGYMSQLAGFYQAIVVSPFIDWLTEYDTIGKTGFADGQPGSNQHIGRGTFAGSFVITPSVGGSTLQDSDVQAELAAQLDAGNLPKPTFDANGNANTLYMIDFPPGYDIVLLGIHACQQYGAYHFTMTYGGKSVPYGIHPNCGYDFPTSTLIHSHELTEAITDMEVGLVNQNAPTDRPAAWVTQANTAWESYENADICQGTSDVVAGYTVQGVWSNYAQGCVAQIPICDGSVAPPECRPCNAFDSGAACSGDEPACATAGAEQGHCVVCTAAYEEACTGATPVCDESTYTCVGCIESADCTDVATPVCDTATKTCVPCASDAECATGHCDTATDATKGQCVDCNDDGDCATDQHCDAHACVDDPTGDGGAGTGGDAAGGGGAAAPIGAGAGEADDEGGCGCRLPAGRGQGGALAALVACVALSAIRRRRPRR